MAASFPIVDLFAGPGGLGEGFSSFRDKDGNLPFDIKLSVEKEASAFETLKLRSFLRQFTGGFPPEYYDFINEDREEPNWEELYPNQWRTACLEAVKLELGAPSSRKNLESHLKRVCGSGARKTVVIGGPPCQAYSVVGRARNRGVDGYEARNDLRHFLYREYIHVLRVLKPAVFVMENVKGMISSAVDGEKIFELVLGDLRRAGGSRNSYKLFSLALGSNGRMQLSEAVDHRSFIVRTERFGVPQARHRIIVIGVRSDIAVSVKVSSNDCFKEDRATARDMLDGLPKLRSGLSKLDSDQNWINAVTGTLVQIAKLSRSDRKLADISDRASRVQKSFMKMKTELHRAKRARPSIGIGCSPRLKKWILDPKLAVAPNNFTRGHMTKDLGRYLFASIFGEVRGRSPKASEFPEVLSPRHRNWTTGKFADRFRVQLYDQPSTTITSHISKDGHYFIHPDPVQCRSLTVREAARLQTFPDNYFFKGNRTQQYVQVGNAVPPFLAIQIAEVVSEVLAAT